MEKEHLGLHKDPRDCEGCSKLTKHKEKTLESYPTLLCRLLSIVAMPYQMNGVIKNEIYTICNRFMSNLCQLRESYCSNTERQVGDENLTCDELVLAMREAARFEEDARQDRGVTGTNVAAAVFFWPGLIGTYANTEEAMDAARDRQEYLSDLYSQKNCSAASRNASNSEGNLADQLLELQSALETGLITQEEYDAARARVLGL